MTALQIAALFFAGHAVVLAWLVWSAPLGYQTVDGFFYGTEPDPLENPDNWGV